MTINWQYLAWVVLGIFIIGAGWWLCYAMGKKIERRCNSCGWFGCTSVHYLEVSQNAFRPPHSRCYDTFTFRICNRCDNVMGKSDTRYLSVWSLAWKRWRLPYQFVKTPRIEELMRMCGFIGAPHRILVGRHIRIAAKPVAAIPPPHRPERKGSIAPHQCNMRRNRIPLD